MTPEPPNRRPTTQNLQCSHDPVDMRQPAHYSDDAPGELGGAAKGLLTYRRRLIENV
jgi:hypothetical protein